MTQATNTKKESKNKTTEQNTIWQDLADIQAQIKVDKSQFNDYGKYAYRSKEDILEAAKKVCHEKGYALLVSDDIELIGNWMYCKSTATLVSGCGDHVSAYGWAREPETRKGMDASQITGCAASYAGKRALGNLLALDDTKDADSMKPEATQSANKLAPKAEGRPVIPIIGRCSNCGKEYSFESATHFASFKNSDATKCCEAPNWEVRNDV